MRLNLQSIPPVGGIEGFEEAVEVGRIALEEILSDPIAIPWMFWVLAVVFLAHDFDIEFILAGPGELLVDEADHGTAFVRPGEIEHITVGKGDPFIIRCDENLRFLAGTIRRKRRFEFMQELPIDRGRGKRAGQQQIFEGEIAQLIPAEPVGGIGAIPGGVEKATLVLAEIKGLGKGLIAGFPILQQERREPGFLMGEKAQAQRALV